MLAPGSASEQECSTCHRSSPTVYDKGWMCLRPGCDAFFKLENGLHPPAHLAYADAFLQPVTFPEESLEDLVPVPPVDSFPVDGVTTTRHYCKGWHCTNCGRLSSRSGPSSVSIMSYSLWSLLRYKWEHWECRTCGVSGMFLLLLLSRNTVLLRHSLEDTDVHV